MESSPLAEEELPAAMPRVAGDRTSPAGSSGLAAGQSPVAPTAQPEAERAVSIEFAVPDEGVCMKTCEFDLTPNGLIKRFMAHYGKVLAFRSGENAWFRWDGKVWREDVNAVEAMHAVRCVAEAIVHLESELIARVHHDVHSLTEQILAARAEGDGAAADKLVQELKDRQKRLKNELKAYGQRCQLESSVRATVAGAIQALRVPEEEWDGPKHLLNVQNGVVDLRTGDLLPHRKGYRFTQIARCEYKPEARHESLDIVLDHVSDGRLEVAEYLQRWLGQAFTGEVSAASILYIWGEAQVGKSTLLNAALALLGEGSDSSLAFASAAKPEAFQKKKAAHDEGFHHLRRCRFVCIVEVQGGMLDVSKLKAISGGDSFDSRRAGGSTVKYFPRMSIAMTSNEVVLVAPEDKGFMERFQPYQVTRQLPKGERKSSVKADLTKTQAGMEAVLAWAVAGAIKWYADGANNAALKAPDDFQAVLHEFTRDMDSIENWLGDNITVVDPAHENSFPAKAIELFNNYKAYTGQGHRGKTAFYHQLSQRGFRRTEKMRWTIREGPRAGATEAPAYWIPGLYITAGVGAFGHPIPGREYVPGTQWGRPPVSLTPFSPLLEAPSPDEDFLLPLKMAEAA